MTDVGNMQPIWKLYGNGSVGSQALLGIPVLTALRNEPALAPVSRVWPFETGFRAPMTGGDSGPLIVHTEIYPSLLPVQVTDGEVKDAAQVRGLAAYFAEADDSDRLVTMFAAPLSLTEAEIGCVEQEEGWTLGVGVEYMAPLQTPRWISSQKAPSGPAAVPVPQQQHRTGGRSTIPDTKIETAKSPFDLPV